MDAQRWLDEVTASIVTGQYVDPKAGLVRFRNYAEQWRKIQAHRTSTQEQVQNHLNKHVYPTLGDVPMNKVLPSMIQALHRQWEDAGLAASTRSVIYRHVSAIFKSAVSDRIIIESPCKVRHVKVVRPAITPLTTDDVTALIDHAPLWLRSIIVFAAGTGARQGECFGLQLDDVDFLRREVRIHNQLQDVKGEGLKFVAVKTEASDRTIPLPQVVVDELAWRVKMFGTGPKDTVFNSATGLLQRRSTFNEHFQQLTKKAGVEATFHDLRHYYASLLIRHGESVKTVQARLGHKSATETLDTYSHLWEDSEERTRSAVDSVLTFSGADSVRTAPKVTGTDA